MSGLNSSFRSGEAKREAKTLKSNSLPGYIVCTESTVSLSDNGRKLVIQRRRMTL